MKEIPAVHSLLLEAFLSLFCFAKLFEKKRIKTSPRRLQLLCPPPQNSSSALPLFGEDPTHQTGSPERREQVYSPSTFFLTWGEDGGCPLTLIPPRWLAPVRSSKFSWLPAGLPPVLPPALRSCWAPQLPFSNICPKCLSLMHTPEPHSGTAPSRNCSYRANLYPLLQLLPEPHRLSWVLGHRTWVVTASVGEVPSCSAYGGQCISSQWQ